MCTRQFAWQENECGSQVSLVGVAIVKISTFHTPPKPKPNPKLPCRNVQKYAGHVFYNGGAGRYSSASPDTVLPAVEAGKSPMLSLLCVSSDAYERSLPHCGGGVQIRRCASCRQDGLRKQNAVQLASHVRFK